MNPDVPAEAPDRVAAAIKAVTSANEAAIAAIAGMSDAGEAFQCSTALWSALRGAMDANGRLRARLAQQIRTGQRLSVDELAEQLDVSKSRANQLLQAARAQDADQAP